MRSSDYVTQHVQDYKIYPETRDAVLLDSVEYLSDYYNDSMGFEAIQLVYEREEANSFIRFPIGLKNSDNKLGLGQWITVTSQEARSLNTSNNVMTKVVRYSMELDFDYQNFREKSINYLVKRDRGALAHLYHLFCHEVGHGLQMDHTQQVFDVMYPSIPERSRPGIDYQSYFTEARNFFLALAQ